MGNWREPEFNLTFQAQDAELLNNDLGEMHANANLRITGPFAHANIAGRVSVVHGVLYIPETDGKKLVGAGDPQLFSVVDTSVALERELFPARSRLFQGLVVDVELTVERGTWVRSKEANVEVYTDGPLQVSVQGDALTLTGAVNADRGEYTFLSKRFQITRGSALFIGSPDINPTVQVTAEYQVKQATNVTNIRVLVGGTVRKPRISLESDAQPPLSQSDLLSYLAFGASTGSLTQIGSTGAIAGGLRGTGVINAAGSRLAGVAVGVGLDELEGDAARSLGMDVFNVSPGDIPIEQGQDAITQFLRGTEIEGGRYVSPSTYASVVFTPGSRCLCRRRVARTARAPSRDSPCNTARTRATGSRRASRRGTSSIGRRSQVRRRRGRASSGRSLFASGDFRRDCNGEYRAFAVNRNGEYPVRTT